MLKMALDMLDEKKCTINFQIQCTPQIREN